MELTKLLYDTDAEIIEEYCNSMSNRAANAFVRKYSSFVYYTAFRYLKNDEDTEDITQEVFIKALSKLHTFNRKSNIKTWLYSITVNHCKNFLRKKKVKKFLRLDSDVNYYEFEDKFNSNPYELLVEDEESNLFMKHIDKLPEKQREVFVLRHFEELPYKEIAKITGKSEGGLKSNYYHAVKKLSESIKSERGK
ncbi:MAG: RNA polymerase sigma factor [Chlorobiota bacterium]